jgi:hypothetical protein
MIRSVIQIRVPKSIPEAVSLALAYVSNVIFYDARHRQRLTKEHKIVNESTSNLAWNLGNGTGEGSYPNYCMFMLFDYTLQKCSWGPFGLLEWDQGGSFQVPLLYSEMFKILPPNSTEPALITNTAKTTKQSPAPVTATQGNITCPPSGIPASPITTVAPQMEMIPPLANNVTFPAWVYPTYIE